MVEGLPGCVCVCLSPAPTAPQDNDHALLLIGWESQEEAVRSILIPWREDTLDKKRLTRVEEIQHLQDLSEPCTHPKYNHAYASDEDSGVLAGWQWQLPRGKVPDEPQVSKTNKPIHKQM